MHLGRQHDRIALGEFLQHAADNFLGAAVGIHVRGIEEIDAQVDRLANQWTAICIVECPRMVAALRLTVGHATETDARYIQASAAELHVLHDGLLMM
jgi:hypothetical protein